MKMDVSYLTLEEQIDIVFRKMANELLSVTSGTVIVHIRENKIGKFGIRHNPVQLTSETLKSEVQGLTVHQIDDFRAMAVRAMKLKRGWTHGKIVYDFMVRNGVLRTSVQLESNYNLASITSVHRRTITIRG